MRSLFRVRNLPVLPLAAVLLAATPLAAQPALTGPEIFVDPASQGRNQWYQCCPEAATDATGHLMVVWYESRQVQWRLRGRVFDPSGAPVRPVFTLATGVETLTRPILAPDAPGGFLLAWQSSDRSLLARRLTRSGRPRGEVIPIRGPVTGFGSIRTASASDGSFVAVWSETNRRTGLADVCRVPRSSVAVFSLFSVAG